MVPFFTTRTPPEQAKLWRQSRSTRDINEKIRYLRNAGAGYLADTIQNVGPQTGRWATNAIPGISWHQWGLAIDCYWLNNGSISWSGDGYRVYAEIAKELGYISGHFWKSVDSVHVQEPVDPSPRRSWNLQQIDEEMRKRWAPGL